MADGSCYPQPGDLIEIYRGVYQHWALYVGDGYVIHLTSAEKEEPLAAVSSTKAVVKKELLKNVVEEDKWRVNNKRDRSCTPRPVKEIIWRAEQWIGKEVPYDVVTRNCEHFVTELRYGKASSQQVRKGVTRALTTVGGVILAGVAVAVVKSFSGALREGSIQTSHITTLSSKRRIMELLPLGNVLLFI